MEISLKQGCRIVPAGFVLNARSLVKPDASAALHLELTNNNEDFCIIAEKWLKHAIPTLLKISVLI